MNLLFGIFLIAHGLVHGLYATPAPDDPQYPFNFMKSWFAGMIGETAKTIGFALVALVIISFVLAGLGVFGLPGLEKMWKPLTLFGAITSTLLFILYWHPWLIIGLLINTAFIYAIYFR